MSVHKEYEQLLVESAVVCIARSIYLGSISNSVIVNIKYYFFDLVPGHELILLNYFGVFFKLKDPVLYESNYFIRD